VARGLCARLSCVCPTYICLPPSRKHWTAPGFKVMFLFNKNNTLPHSRQSSIDSLVTDPSTATSTSETCVSQCSDTSSYSELPSPEQRERFNPGKRTSVFKIRSRSNTATSTASSFVSVTPTMFGSESSHDSHYLPGQSFIELPGPKRSLFMRGKRAKRQSGHLISNLHVEDIEEDELGSRRTSVLRKTKRGIQQTDSSRMFSIPFLTDGVLS
jgi:hypothetical protein